MTKEEVFKLVDKEVEVVQQALDRIAKALYDAGFNEGVDDAANLAETYSVMIGQNILKLKK